MTPEAAPLEDRQHALAEPVCLLQVRVAGEDELGDAGLGVLLDEVGDLLVAADQGGACAAAGAAGAIRPPTVQFLGQIMEKATT